MATTASLPMRESTDSLIAPFWMYLTSLQGSPCEKTTSPRWYFTTFRAGPVDSRYVSTSNRRRVFGPTGRVLDFISDVSDYRTVGLARPGLRVHGVSTI